MDTKSYKLPPTFYWDHVTRELPAGTLIRETARQVIVELTEAEYDEILSDAEFYLDSRYGPQIDPGLRASARATAKRLRAEPFTGQPREKRRYRLTRPQAEIDAGWLPKSLTTHAYDEERARYDLLLEIGLDRMPSGPESWSVEDLGPVSKF